jgi:ADP-ribosylglycohydrolase
MKIYDGIMGLVVADAVGVPFEFKKRDTFKADKMTGYGTYNQPPGTWSDDSSLTLATVASMGRKGKIDPADIMNNFFLWLDDGAYTPYGKVFDVGGSTRKAISRYANGVEPLNCGGKTRMDNGNGALMRILPLAFIPHTAQDILKVGKLTHAHEISQTACRLYVHLAGKLIEGTPIKEAICSLAYLPPVTQMKEFERIAYIGELNRDEIKSSGYVVDTLEAALWCLWATNTYKDCVLTAVNLGEDTDTVAAVAGGLAGIVYGCGGKNGIPTRWINQIARKEWIQMLCDNFESKFSKHST